MSVGMYPPPKKRFNPAFLKLVGVELLIILIIAIPLVIILNYFRILNLPFLPQRLSTTEEQKRDKIIYEEQPIKYVCPLEQKLCVTGKQVVDIKERRVSGFGYKFLPKGTKIQAAFNGTAQVILSTANGKNITTIQLTDEKNENIVIYAFSGAAQLPNPQGIVKQKDVIGEVSGEAAEVTGFSTAQYALFVRARDLVTSQELPLKPSKDGKGLGY